MFADFPCTSSVPCDPPPEVARVAHEMAALQAALLVVEQAAAPKQARLLVRTYLAHLDPATTEERVIEAALRRILGKEVTKPPHEAKAPPPPLSVDWEAHVADVVSFAWSSWAANDNKRAVDAVKGLRGRRKSREAFSGRTGAIHLLTLSFWSQATLLLIEEDRIGAKRFFKRALELGSQFGTESHPMISWAYAASFFEGSAAAAVGG